MTPQERKVMELEEILDYNPKTGSLTWKVRRGSKGAGTIASYKNTKGYVGICIDRKHMKAHRVAWLMTYGELPNGDIDHIDGNPSNNKLDNLRDVSHSANKPTVAQGTVLIPIQLTPVGRLQRLMALGTNCTSWRQSHLSVPI